MRAAIVAGLLGVATPAAAHIALTSPPARHPMQKEGPCGLVDSVRGTNVTTFEAGQTITVEWDETVGHVGHYRIAFDDNGDDVFKNPNNPNDNFAFTLVEPIADKDGTQHYTQQVTLPNIECTSCTLQLMQVMTTTEPYNSFYWQCADIQIGDGMQPPGDDSGGGCSTSRGAGLLVGLALIAFLRRRR